MLWKTAAEFMKKDPITITPNTKLGDLLELFEEEKIHGVPVVDPLGVPLGVISTTDIMRAFGEGNLDDDLSSPFYQWTREDSFRGIPTRKEGRLDLTRSIKAFMSDRIVSAPEATSVGTLAAIMLKEKVHRILITRNKRLVGIVSVTDLLHCVVEAEKNKLAANLFQKITTKG